MKFKSVKKITEGKHIVRYDITYETVDNYEKIYEMISRDKTITSLEDIQAPKIDAVILIMHNLKGDKILINKEFRMATGEWVYNFPAGLVEQDEEPEEAARRELFEETGLMITRIDDVMGISYSAIGFSNERNICFVGVAEGEIAPSNSTVEEIEAEWFSKEEVRNLLKNEKFAARTQSYCYLWSKQ